MRVALVCFLLYVASTNIVADARNSTTGNFGWYIGNRQNISDVREMLQARNQGPIMSSSGALATFIDELSRGANRAAGTLEGLVNKTGNFLLHKIPVPSKAHNVPIPSPSVPTPSPSTPTPSPSTPTPSPSTPTPSPSTPTPSPSTQVGTYYQPNAVTTLPGPLAGANPLGEFNLGNLAGIGSNVFRLSAPALAVPIAGGALGLPMRTPTVFLGQASEDEDGTFSSSATSFAVCSQTNTAGASSGCNIDPSYTLQEPTGAGSQSYGACRLYMYTYVNGDTYDAAKPCTATFINNRTMVTAAHCVSEGGTETSRGRYYNNVAGNALGFACCKPAQGKGKDSGKESADDCLGQYKVYVKSTVVGENWLAQGNTEETRRARDGALVLVDYNISDVDTNYIFDNQLDMGTIDITPQIEMLMGWIGFPQNSKKEVGCQGLPIGYVATTQYVGGAIDPPAVQSGGALLFPGPSCSGESGSLIYDGLWTGCCNPQGVSVLSVGDICASQVSANLTCGKPLTSTSCSDIGAPSNTYFGILSQADSTCNYSPFNGLIIVTQFTGGFTDDGFYLEAAIRRLGGALSDVHK